MKRKIGIPGYNLNTGGTTPCFGVAHTYLKFAELFGEPIIIMPWEETAKVDLLLLTGGLDVAPGKYGRNPGFATSNQDIFKQHFLDYKLKNYVGNTAIFGICLGFQQLNVHFGGTLIQDLPFHSNSPDRGKKGHEVELLGFTFKEGKKKGQQYTFEVNSHHHQGIGMEDIAQNFKVLCVSADTEFDSNMKQISLIEAFQHETLPIAGVQWHPEEWTQNPIAKELIERILKVKDEQTKV